MKKIISVFLAVCLMAVWGSARAESNVPEGKPWINSDLLINLPAERPAVEDGLDMYANYDAYGEMQNNGLSSTITSLEEAETVSREQILGL